MTSSFPSGKYCYNVLNREYIPEATADAPQQQCKGDGGVSVRNRTTVFTQSRPLCHGLFSVPGHTGGHQPSTTSHVV